MPEVRLVGPNGEQVGIVPISRALDMAAQADLDLVEVAATARPPVVKIMDYGKFKYENAQKAREARRNQVLTVIKEMKLRPKIDGHDYETKKGHVVRFLKVGDKVKVTIMFRGREQSRPELGFRLLQRLAADVADLGFVEAAPKLDGRNMIMVLAPHKAPTKVAKSPTPASGPRTPRGEQVQGSQVDGDEDVSDDLDDDDMTDDTTTDAPVTPAAPAEPAPEPIFKKAAVPPTPIAAPERPERLDRPDRAERSSSGRPPSGTRPSGPSSRPSAPRPTSNPSGPSAPSSAPSTGSSAPSSAPRPPAPSAPRPAVRPATTGGTPGKPGGGAPRPGAPGPRPGAPGPRPPKPTT